MMDLSTCYGRGLGKWPSRTALDTAPELDAEACRLLALASVAKDDQDRADCMNIHDE